MSAAEDTEVETDDAADTIPAPPDMNSREVAEQLERLALKHLDKHIRGDSFYSGWVDGIREAAEHVRHAGDGR